MLYSNGNVVEISNARKLVDASINRLNFIKKRFDNGNRNHEEIVKKTNMLLIEYQQLDKEVKKYEYN